MAYCICRGHENLAYSACARPPPLPPRAGKSRRRTDGRTGIGANLGRSWNKTWTPRMTKATQRILKNPLKIHSRGSLGYPKLVLALSPSFLERSEITCDPPVSQKVAKIHRKLRPRARSGTQVGRKDCSQAGLERKKCIPKGCQKR